MAFRQQQPRQQRQESDRKPVQSWSYPSAGGFIEVSVWENTVQGEGGERITHSVTFQRSYKQGKDWQHSKSLFPRDIPVLLLALQKAFDFTMNETAKQ